jgi:hypothetical protein
LFQVKTLHTELLHLLSTYRTPPPLACSQSSFHVILPSPPAPPPPHSPLGNHTRKTRNAMASGDRELMRQAKTFRLQQRDAQALATSAPSAACRGLRRPMASAPQAAIRRLRMAAACQNAREQTAFPALLARKPEPAARGARAAVLQAHLQ